jgi:sugar/nucleoside kinase (ribokinase family)
VLVLGDVNVDLVIRLPDYANPDKALRKSEPLLFGGGTCANTATGLARLGVTTSFVGALGDDGFGRWVLNDFAENGVETSGVAVVRDAFTPQVIAMIRPDGERDLVVFPPHGAADRQLAPEHLDAARIRAARWLHTTGILLRESPSREAILFAMRIAHEAGVPVSIDVNLRDELWGYDAEMAATVSQALAFTDVLLGSSERELLLVAGQADLMTAVHALADGRRTVVARLGADGALAVGPDGRLVQAPAGPVTLVDTLGAGDAFNAGYIACVVEGGDLACCLAAGNRVAAYKIGGAGARHLPTRAEVSL